MPATMSFSRAALWKTRLRVATACLGSLSNSKATFRAGELHGVVMHQIAEDQQLLATALEQVAGVARGVAVGVDAADAGQQFAVAVEGLPLAGSEIGRCGVARHLEERLEILRCLVGDCFAQPEFVVGFGRPDFGIDEDALPVRRDQAVNMVAVQVGDEHGIDLLRAVTGGLEVVDNIAEARPEKLGGTGVDQDQLVSGIDQIGIDGGLDLWPFQELAGEETLDVALVDVLEQFLVEIDGAVVEGGDFELAEHQAIVARDLGFLLRCFGNGQAAAEQEQAGNGQAAQGVLQGGNGVDHSTLLNTKEGPGWPKALAIGAEGRILPRTAWLTNASWRRLMVTSPFSQRSGPPWFDSLHACYLLPGCCCG